ncbi:hypothetical protein B0H12DRAFT_1154746 [Mycena haematopus]|nr:hypothetical protein B0H12DRAFT_1154746 [Mycena haematopus]
MDTKTPLPFQDLPAPASHEGQSPRAKHCKKRKVFHKLALSAFLLWVGSRYIQFRSPSMTLSGLDDAPWPIPSDMVQGVDCEPWSDIDETDPDLTDFPYSADASFELPASADTLFLISRTVGHSHRRTGFAAGHVNYLQSDEVSDSVKVDIKAYFWHEEYLDRAKVCLLKHNGGDQTGVGIFTKPKDDHRDRRSEHRKLRFDVTVTFPGTEDDESPLAINRFLTDLQIFSQTFADLSHVAFGKLEVKSAVAGIRAESLSAGNASITTSLGAIKIQSLVSPEAFISASLGPIEGTYNGSKLTFITTNGGIHVDVNLSNDRDDTAELKLLTSNGPIHSNVTLLSSKEDTADSAFNITARTSHGPIGVDVLSAPLNSNIALHATTALGPAAVALPATYEGAVRASTSLGSVEIFASEDVEDPAGEGRTRRVEFEQVRGSLSVGRVGWSEDGLGRGEVDVKTSIAGVKIQL